ncbi:hypothetical protein QUS22_03940 [Wolbachia pipientis]|uniref:hypothetical protein n=1 Tax=Wolbachia pipientis TaxID=955 RepID=UPI0025A3D422|nr:hypothetical protein [Wolbachia pipientis]MDM8335531.1 hypothetical protein [Wolbachia pipientis]
MLAHDPKVDCKNKNIHSDDKKHFLVHRKNKDNGSITEYVSYEKVKNQFIDEAHKYLLKHGFNGKENYREGYVSRSFTK